MSRNRKSAYLIKDYTTEEFAELIDLYVFSERDRQMLKRFLIDDKTYAHIAEEFNYSLRHTQRIICNAENELFKRLKRDNRL